MNITKAQAKAILLSTKGKCYAVNFTKTDGTQRSMVCRNEVKKGVTGKGMSYNPATKGQFVTWSMNDKGWKSFKLDNLQQIVFRGVRYNVAGE